MSELALKLKYKSTIVMSNEPDACPKCHCPRFSSIPLTVVDKALSRKRRFQCDKCKVVTLQVAAAALGKVKQVQEMPEANREPTSTPKELALRKFKLASQYANGEGFTANSAAAFTLFSQAAQLGHPNAQFNVAVFYLKGDVVAKDLQQAIRWMSLSAQQGHGKAKQVLPQLTKLAGTQNNVAKLH